MKPIDQMNKEYSENKYQLETILWCSRLKDSATDAAALARSRGYDILGKINNLLEELGEVLNDAMHAETDKVEACRRIAENKGDVFDERDPDYRSTTEDLLRHVMAELDPENDERLFKSVYSRVREVRADAAQWLDACLALRGTTNERELVKHKEQARKMMEKAVPVVKEAFGTTSNKN